MCSIYIGQLVRAAAAPLTVRILLILRMCVCNINSAAQNFGITLYGIFIVFLKFKKCPLSFELAFRQVHSLSFFCLYVLVQISVKQKCLYSVSFFHRP